MNAAVAQQLFNSYREGLLNKEGPQRKDYHPRFQVLLRQILLNQLSLMERLYVRKVWKASAQGLDWARKGNLEEAAMCLRLGREAIAGYRLSRVGYLMSTSILESAEAYLGFREHHFDQARDRLRSAMDADLALVHDEDFELLELHRIQSAVNLMRLELQVDHPLVACSLGGEIIGYLENLKSGLPVHHSWQQEALLRTPRAVRRAMVTQVANEMATALSRLDDSAAWREFSEPLESSLYLVEGVALHAHVRRWVSLKQSFERRDWSNYLILLNDFLPGGRKDISPIWYSSVLDFLFFCRTVELDSFRQVRAGILRDSRKWPAFPAALRSCLGREEEQSFGALPCRS
jgi:hypothetical protein